MISVEIKTVMWQKDSHGLFDYENSNHKYQKFMASESCCLHQKSKFYLQKYFQYDEIKIEHDLGSELNSFKEDSVSLLNLTISRNSALVQQNTILNKMKLNYQQQFLIVRSLKNNEGNQKGYQIQINDVIKLGRIEFKVVEMKGKDQIVKKVSDHWMNEERQSNDQQESEEKSKDEVLCRICYENTLKQECESGEHQFVYICQCKGSCANIHLHCLKKWIKQKPIIKKETNVIKYKLQKFECELCKDILPFKFKHNNMQFTLLDLEKPSQEPYLILEQNQQKKDNQENRPSKNNTDLFLIKFNELNQLEAKLGRGHNCEIRISDISVSRLHSKINYDPKTNEFLLFDNNSKFGSLVLLQKPFGLKQDRIALQVGRTVITIFLKNITNNEVFFDKKAFHKNFFKNNKETEKEIAEFKKQVVYNEKENVNSNKKNKKNPDGHQDIFQNLDEFENLNQLLKEEQG